MAHIFWDSSILGAHTFQACFRPLLSHHVPSHPIGHSRSYHQAQSQEARKYTSSARRPRRGCACVMLLQGMGSCERDVICTCPEDTLPWLNLWWTLTPSVPPEEFFHSSCWFSELCDALQQTDISNKVASYGHVRESLRTQVRCSNDFRRPSTLYLSKS